MTLITWNGQAQSQFLAVETAEALAAAEGPVIVPLALARAALDGRRNAPLGLLVANDASPDDIAPFFDKVELIAIAFPSFSDGRGLSLARKLRRAGFTGRLRASGPVIADQFADCLACGFDEVDLPEGVAARQPMEQWLKARSTVTSHYQTGYAHGASILEQRRAGRGGASS
ncbi:DUF934 domain-containing protein [Consotaella salsifontis]|uniref:Uncharacterized conserved protein, DUF934 family n=1 Tax=Consotaella salsifontis TaxID=1365950 RepID=A0A1T4SCN8_9HYPH|nr:DUF934 domain-containing protein [Consotaella salsifontis]SKA25896.1 Uncharacterized conserved protein, DUF934 family [Consotaella salsifontis]